MKDALFLIAFLLENKTSGQPQQSPPMGKSKLKNKECQSF